jgi:hypothetical protein
LAACAFRRNQLQSFDGTPVQGWLMKPLDFKEGGRYPLILSVHGGPHGAYGYSFNPSFQVYAARGYAVLYLNPRGSTGYGQKFSDGTIGEWGGGDYQDLMRGVDEVLRTRAWIDPNRLGVTGGSYGGFMTNGLSRRHRVSRRRFLCFRQQSRQLYATSLYQDLIHAEFNGFPWDNYDTLWRWSPIRYVKQAQTPTLFYTASRTTTYTSRRQKKCTWPCGGAASRRNSCAIRAKATDCANRAIVLTRSNARSIGSTTISNSKERHRLLQFVQESLIRATPARVFAFHELPDAILRLLPPWEKSEHRSGRAESSHRLARHYRHETFRIPHSALDCRAHRV